MTRPHVATLSVLALVAAVLIRAALAQDAAVPGVTVAPPMAQSPTSPIRLSYWLAECDGWQVPRWTGPGDTWGEVRRWTDGRARSSLLVTPTGRVMVEGYRLGVRDTWQVWSIRGPRRLYRWQLARPDRCRIVQTYRAAWRSADAAWTTWLSSRVDAGPGGRFAPPILYGGEDADDSTYLSQED